MSKRMILASAALLAFGAIAASTPASATPMAGKDAVGAPATSVEQVRLVCDAWGRCWRTGPRYGYYGGGYGGGYGFYGGGYGRRHWGGHRHWGHRHW